MEVKETNEGRKGGILKGDSHSDKSGGIKAVVTDNNNKPVLLEGGEVVINKKAVNDSGVKTITGTNKEILNKINTSTGGVQIFDDGGKIGIVDTSTCDNTDCKNRNNCFKESELMKGIDVEKEHQQTFDKLYAHEINPEDAVRETAEEHLSEDADYYSKLKDMDKFGKGGKLETEGTDTGTGKLYEFFTPFEVIEKMWSLAYHYGFKNGSILEPAMGSGRMFKYAPNGSKITGFEINKQNFDVANEYVRDLEKFSNIEFFNESFETAFLHPDRFNTLYKDKTKKTWLENYPFDLVIANPPYGKFTGLYKTHFKFSGQFEHFFIDKSMELVKSGGLGIFILPSSFMRNGNTYNEIKERIFSQCKLVDAYRLPTNIFVKTQIGTDIIILKKK